MILDRKELEVARHIELKQLMVTMGGSSSPHETKAELIERLLLLAAKQPAPERENDPKPVTDTTSSRKEAPNNTVEDVKNAVAPFILQGLEYLYNPEDHTWFFRVRLLDGRLKDTNTGETIVFPRWAEDSGTMRMPLKMIKRCAQNLIIRKPKAMQAVTNSVVSNKYQRVQ